MRAHVVAYGVIGSHSRLTQYIVLAGTPAASGVTTAMPFDRNVVPRNKYEEPYLDHQDLRNRPS